MKNFDVNYDLLMDAMVKQAIADYVKNDDKEAYEFLNREDVTAYLLYNGLDIDRLNDLIEYYKKIMK